MTNKLDNNQQKKQYEVVATDLEILKKGDIMTKDGGYYVNSDETVIIKSDNFTGRIFKLISK